MRTFILVFVVFVAPLVCQAGPLARQYGNGYDGGLWGDSLVELVKKKPNGNHYFSNLGGLRTYHVENDQPMFDLARKHMRNYYFFDDTDSVVSVSIAFPYEERMKLMAALPLSYGPYKTMVTKGIANIYTWPSDDGTTISLRETLSPTIGI